MRSRRIALFLALAAVVANGCKVSDRRIGADSARKTPAVAPFRIPSDSEVADAHVLASVRRGRALLRYTRDSLPAHVGNGLTCASCHVLDGTQKNVLPLVG